MANLEKYHLTITNKKAQKLTDSFLHIGYIMCLIAILILYCNNNYFISKDFYSIGILIFRMGLLTAVFSVICGIFFSNYEYLRN